MTAHLNITERRDFWRRNWLTVRVGGIVVIGFLLTAIISLWASIPIVNSLAQLSTDSHQLQSFSDTRLQLVELFKLRKALVESQIKNCGEFSDCTIAIAGHKAIGKKLKDFKVPGNFDIQWDGENDFRAFDGQGWWSFHIDVKPVQPLAEDIASWLSAHEHLDLISDDLTRSFIMTMAFTTSAGVLLCLVLVYMLSRNLRDQYAALADYIRTLAGGVTQPIPKLLQNKGELSGLAREVHSLSEELAAAQKRIIEAERMTVWQTVARKVAHEIKNPLTPIGLVGEQLAGLAKSIQDPQLKNTLSESSRIIGEETGSLNRMVREFTAFGRLPSPKLQSCDLNQIVRDFVERNQSSYSGTVCIDFKSSEEAAHSKVDAAMIHQVLHNLLNNARLAKVPDAVALNVAVSKYENFWTIDVTDDGPGVPESIRERMFDAYVTTRSTGEKEKGMGLGLTISRQIAIDHGGTLTLHRTGSDGTTMRLCIPVTFTKNLEVNA